MCGLYITEPHSLKVWPLYHRTTFLKSVAFISHSMVFVLQDDVHLVVEGKYELTVKLPNIINDSESAAKFSKKRSTLTLTMPLNPASNGSVR